MAWNEADDGQDDEDGELARHVHVEVSTASPAEGGMRPARSFRSVDFPHPEGPTTATNSPSLTVKLMS
jgi:hypothetical protein